MGEQNRQLKLINIAEKLERENWRKGSRTSSPRLPDSTTEVEGEESKDTMENTDDSDSDDEGGCSSGCCLAQSCREEVAERLREVEEEDGSEEEEITTGAFLDGPVTEQEDQSLNEDTLNVEDTSHTTTTTDDDKK